MSSAIERRPFEEMRTLVEFEAKIDGLMDLLATLGEQRQQIRARLAVLGRDLSDGEARAYLIGANVVGTPGPRVIHIAKVRGHVSVECFVARDPMRTQWPDLKADDSAVEQAVNEWAPDDIVALARDLDLDQTGSMAR